MSTRAKMLSRRCRSRASRYSGTRLAAKGRNRVEMKKKSTSRVRFTGLIDNAYAAGKPRISTSRVEPMLAIAELMKNGGKSPDSTSWNSARVGAKSIVGGELAAWGSVLKLSSHIHSTGKKKTKTTSQPTIDHTTFEITARRASTREAITVLPPPGRWKRACAAQTSRRRW